MLQLYCECVISKQLSRENEFKARRTIVNSTYVAKLPCRKFGIKRQRQTAILIRYFTAHSGKGQVL